ncbi:sensor histidine kinase [Streptomyces sp. SAJ15]|uniref:sensor histidine kinase n=1 Tax=Streptomyces sp. SAJ15 TaxID=2011095 RepID=UPI0011865231|nr:histidine kinase [Streptomyces sp. SAJ15]TVL94179.1 two-component sensor histidine kinase [Streptomyces sp. SAJ15]
MQLRRPARPHRDDVLIAIAGLLGGLILLGLGLTNGPMLLELPGWTVLVALLAMCGAELLRRTAPHTALTIGTLALALDLCTRGLIANMVMFTDLMYAAVLYGSPSLARRLPRTSELLTVLAAVVPLAIFREPEALLLGVGTGVLTVAPAWTGAIIRNHRDAAEAAKLRAEQTALLAEMDRTQAVQAERARMARELHDMVANHLSAIAIHSTAALSIDEPTATREALGVIRENSVQGLAEMRRLIGLLRDAGAEAEPAAAPTLEGLDALLERARTTAEAARSASGGVRRPGEAAGGLEFTLCDERSPTAPPLPTPVELAAYRIVQESLTNAVKHAGPGEVLVTLGHADGGLRVQVTSAYGDRPGPSAPGSGSGLLGMEERVALLGGAFTAGPVATAAGHSRSWQVTAVLPVDEETTP